MENRPMRIIVIVVLSWTSVDGFAGAESASPAAEPAMLGIAAGYPNDEAPGTLVFDDLLTRDEVKTLRDAVSTDEDRKVVEEYWERERPVGIAVKPLDKYARPVRVPPLTVTENGRRTLLEPVELGCFAWNLDECNSALAESEFESDIRVGGAAMIDIQEGTNGQGGGLFTQAAGDVRLTGVSAAAVLRGASTRIGVR